MVWLGSDLSLRRNGCFYVSKDLGDPMIACNHLSKTGERIWKFWVEGNDC